MSNTVQSKNTGNTKFFKNHHLSDTPGLPTADQIAAIQAEQERDSSSEESDPPPHPITKRGQNALDAARPFWKFW